MNKILCIGEALIDMICTDKGRSLSDGDHFLKKAGGAPTNVAAAIAALGGNVDIVAKVGKDPFGTHIIEVLKSFGISFTTNKYGMPIILAHAIPNSTIGKNNRYLFSMCGKKSKPTPAISRQIK